MRYCQKCGATMGDADNFCTNCGQSSAPSQSVWQPAYSPHPYATAPYFQPVAQPKQKKPAIPYFVFGLLLFILINPLGSIFGAVGTIFAVIANSDECEDPEDKLAKSKIFLIAAAFIDAVTIITCVAVWIIKMWL